MYTNVNDAAKVTNNQGYAPGSTRIWYARPEKGRDLRMGHEWCFERKLLPSPKNLAATHIEVGAIAATDPEDIFEMMQGEAWSPAGQSRGLIVGLGLDHTSMSVGDVIQVGDNVFMVDRCGFVLLDGK